MSDTDEKTQVPPAKKRRHRQGPRMGPGSNEAQRIAACVLEVLGGARTPTEAANVLSIPVPRYYLLESRALHGLLAACEPRPVGRVQSPERTQDTLTKEVERLRRECNRYAALHRMAQRAVGLPAPVPKPKDKLKGKGKGARRPVVRALKAVSLLENTPRPVENAELVTSQP